MPLEYFVARERALLGQRYEALYAPPQAVPARGVTVSSLRCAPQRFAALADFSIEPSPFCAAGFLVKEPGFQPGRHPYYHAGVFYSQEPSASAPAALLDVAPGMRVLDLCAAPGGKAAQLACALAGQGLLVANEYVASRAEILKQNLERMGVCNALILNESPNRLAQVFPQFFDRILVDAPCSGEGMFRKEAAAVTQHSEALVEHCAALGKDILEAAAAMLAPGGVLVYSTCTFAPQEDEGQVAAFLARHPEFSLLPCGGTFGAPGEVNRSGGLPLEAEKLRRIWPCHGGEGHFMAKLKKRDGGAQSPAQALPATAQGRGRGKRRENQSPSPQEDIRLWQEFCQRLFPHLAGRPVQRLGQNLLLPAPCPAVPLHVVRSGVFAGRLEKNRFEPAHQLFMCHGAACVNQEALTLQDPRTLEWLRGNEIEARTAENGWCAVLVDGFPLGGGKCSGGRIKNHYPKALRLLK